MSRTVATAAATTVFERLQSFIRQAERLPPVNQRITRITAAGAADLNTTTRGSNEYLAIADRISDELAGPASDMSELAVTFRWELEHVENALSELERAVRGRRLGEAERSYVRDIAGTLQVFVTGYAATALSGVERLAQSSRVASGQLPGELGSTLGRIADHATALLETLYVISSWGPRAAALGAGV